MCRKQDESSKSASASSHDGSHVENTAKTVSHYWSSLKNSFNTNFERLLCVKLRDVASFEKFTQFLYRPTDPASLGVARALFGKSARIDNKKKIMSSNDFCIDYHINFDLNDRLRNLNDVIIIRVSD